MIKPLMGQTMDKFQLFGDQDWLPVVLEKLNVTDLPEGFNSYNTEDVMGYEDNNEENI